MRHRRGRPLLILDIAVPRDVEPECGDIDGVTLIDVDGLQRAVRRNLSVRAAEARRAERILEEELEHFAEWLAALEVMPTIAALRSRAQGIVEHMLAENAKGWESESDREKAERLARAVANRLLHEPTLRLRAQGGHGRLQTVRELFGLEQGTPEQPQSAEDGNVRSLHRRA